MNTLEARYELRLLNLIEKLERMGQRHDRGRRSSTIKLADSADRHYRADRLLLELINDQRVTEAFDSIPKHYG